MPTHLDSAPDPNRLPDPPVSALAWHGDAASGHLSILDQTRLPAETVWNARSQADEVTEDIRRLAVRGAPAIGIAAAYALVLAAREVEERHLERAAERIASARPTAVNLRAAVSHGLARVRALDGEGQGAAECLLAAARDLEAYEVAACAAIARLGADWLRGHTRFLTHCNAGALVTPGLGTALAPLYLLHAQGEAVHVWVDETRPLMQGLRLTAYELGRGSIPDRVLADNAAADLIRRGRVDAAIVGADRVCRNGDVVNKIGTYGVALACERHGIPFVVAAPLSTLDPDCERGDDVAIEERPDDLERYLRPGLAPLGLSIYAPAFDVTPAGLVAALITDAGVIERPDASRLEPHLSHASALQAGRLDGR